MFTGHRGARSSGRVEPVVFRAKGSCEAADLDHVLTGSMHPAPG
jgi:hypothetical protein